MAGQSVAEMTELAKRLEAEAEDLGASRAAFFFRYGAAHMAEIADQIAKEPGKTVERRSAFIYHMA